MAYSAPSQRAVGFLVTASVWNQDVKDNIIELHDPPACRAYHSTSQSVTHNTPIALALNSERFDNNIGTQMHDPVTNNSRITLGFATFDIPTGVYLISAHCGGTWPKGNYSLGIRLNGGTFLSQKTQRQSNASSIFQAISVSALHKAALDDYVEMWVSALIDVGSGSITIDGGVGYSPELAAEWIGAGV